MAIDRGNGTTTQLLTLLNVSATKAGKRKWLLDDIQPKQKLNKRRATVQFGEVASKDNSASVQDHEMQDATISEIQEGITDDGDEEEVAAEDEPVQGAFSYPNHCHILTCFSLF